MEHAIAKKSIPGCCSFVSHRVLGVPAEIAFHIRRMDWGGVFRDILYSSCQLKILTYHIGQIKSHPEKVRNCATASKGAAVLFPRRTFDLIVTFIRPYPNVSADTVRL
jgi:hypothetical protein